MAPTVYLIYPSPPCRAVLITAKAIGLNLAEKEIKLLEGENLQPPYLKVKLPAHPHPNIFLFCFQLNPQHTVPTLVDDDGFTLWDSHAIMVYLVSKYAKNDALYPKDLKKRALIDQRLHFDSGVVFAQLRRIVVSVFQN
jgi:glutathione S-transferase